MRQTGDRKLAAAGADVVITRDDVVPYNVTDWIWGRPLRDRVGVYEVVTETGSLWYSYWTGEVWSCVAATVAAAYGSRIWPTGLSIYRFRGLARPQ